MSVNYKEIRTKRQKYGIKISIYNATDKELEKEKVVLSNRVVEINQILAGKVDVLSIEEKDSLHDERNVVKGAYADIRDELIRRKRRHLEELNYNLSALTGTSYNKSLI